MDKMPPRPDLSTKLAHIRGCPRWNIFTAKRHFVMSLDLHPGVFDHLVREMTTHQALPITPLNPNSL